jgi:hypothetical protein
VVDTTGRKREVCFIYFVVASLKRTAEFLQIIFTYFIKFFF